MIAAFVKAFDQNRETLRAQFAESHPSHDDIIKAVVTVCSNDDDYPSMDPDRIHKIDDGDYQGTMLFIIASKSYQPSDYWSVFVGYGSCSVCDTLQGIRDNGSWGEKPTEQQVDDYMTLALHAVQGLKVV